MWSSAAAMVGAVVAVSGGLCGCCWAQVVLAALGSAKKGTIGARRRRWVLPLCSSWEVSFPSPC